MTSAEERGESHPGYVLYGGELSYFTRKLEAALGFYDLPFEFRSKNRDNTTELEQRSGTHQVPVLQTPENWVIADTTPILQLLDSRFPLRRMFPAGPLGVLVHVLEEFFDEWIARTMVHYRWHHPESASFASLKIAQGDEAMAARVRDWGPRACRATGTDSPVQQHAAEAEYVRILAAMESQLAETRYLLGDRPTALDCVVLGGLRAHTLMDPDPRRVVARYPRVVAWCERDADGWSGDGDLLPFPGSTGFARFVLQEMPGTYRRFVLANREALGAGSRAFQADIYGEQVSYLTRPYPERSRQMIEDRIAFQLAPADRQDVRAWLTGIGLGGGLFC